MTTRTWIGNFVLAGVWLVWAALMAASLAALIFLSANERAEAAAAEVKIADLDCNGSPEVVEIENEGPDPQNLAGWKLLSDPVATESFDLSELGSLPAGSSIFIESGPGAQATFTWSGSQVFRNNDTTDFVRLVDDTGQTRGQTACAAQATATASPSPSATAAPTPTAAPAVNVPNGGGPPGEVTDLPSPPVLAVAAGGSLLSLGALALSAAWLGSATRSRKRREGIHAEVVALSAPTLPMPVRRASQAAQDASRPLLMIIAVAIVGAILVAMFSHPSTGRSGK